MRFSGITIEKTTVFEFYHNAREEGYIPLSSIFPRIDNEVAPSSAKEAELTYKNLLKSRESLYFQKTGQKLQKTTIKLLSAVVNLNETHTIEDLKKAANYLAGKLNTDVLQTALHKDEGYIDENGEKHINYHGHIILLNLDKNGYTIQRRLKKNTLREIQNDIAKILNMPRVNTKLSASVPHLKLKNTIKMKNIDKKLLKENHILKEKIYNLENLSQKQSIEIEKLKNKRKKTLMLLLKLRQNILTLKEGIAELKAKNSLLSKEIHQSASKDINL